MEKILFINACTRPCSRTLELTKTLLQRLNGDIEEIKLYETNLPFLNHDGIEKRNAAAHSKNFSDSAFDFAKQFAAADVIVFAAPYWDLMFPAVLKSYLENVTVAGITFCYSEQGCPQGLCNAKSLYYVTTSGGFIGQNDFGFSYVKALAQNFFEINKIHRYSAEGLDIFGTDVETVMQRAKIEIESDTQKL